MYNLEPQWFKVAGNSDNHYVFEFSPGDLGRAKFRHSLDAGEWRPAYGARRAEAEICEGAKSDETGKETGMGEGFPW